MKPMTYSQIVDLVKDIEHRSVKEITMDEYKSILQSCLWDELLSIYLVTYPPVNFMKYYRRARDHYFLNQTEEQHKDVHDPIYDKSREQALKWLENNLKGVESINSWDEAQTRYDLLFNEENLSIYVDKKYDKESLSKKNAIKSDFYLFMNKYLKYYYEHNQSAGENIAKIFSYLEKKDVSSILKENFIEILISAFDEARRAYEDKVFKYVEASHELAHSQPRDWSCYPGVNERLLDAIGAYGLSIDPSFQEAQMKISPFYEYQEIVCGSMLKKEEHVIIPSPLLNSLILEAVLPRGYLLTKIKNEHYHIITENHEKLEEYAHHYAEDQVTQKRNLLNRIAEVVLHQYDPSFKDFLDLVFNEPEIFEEKTSYLKKEDLGNLILLAPGESIQKSLKKFLNKQGLGILLGVTAEQIPNLFYHHFYPQDKLRFMNMLEKDFQSEAEASLYLAHLNLGGDFRVQSFYKEELALFNPKREQVSLSSIKIDKQSIMDSLNQKLSQKWIALLNSINSKIDTDLIDVFKAMLESSNLEVILDQDLNFNPTVIQDKLTEIKQKGVNFLNKERYWSNLKYVDYLYWNESFKQKFNSFFKSKIRGNLTYFYDHRLLMQEGFYASDDLLSEVLDFSDELYFDHGEITAAGEYVLAFLYSHSCEKTFYKILEFLLSQEDFNVLRKLSNIFLKSSIFPIDDSQERILRNFLVINKNFQESQVFRGSDFLNTLLTENDFFIKKAIIAEDKKIFQIFREINPVYFEEKLKQYCYLDNGVKTLLAEFSDSHDYLKAKIKEMIDELSIDLQQEKLSDNYGANMRKMKLMIVQLSAGFLNEETSLDESLLNIATCDGLIFENDFEILRCLIAQGQNLNIHDKDGKTILIHAVEFAKVQPENNIFIDLIELLIESGANINEKDLEGESALTLVKAPGQEMLFTKLNEKLQAKGDNILFSITTDHSIEDANDLITKSV